MLEIFDGTEAEVMLLSKGRRLIPMLKNKISVLSAAIFFLMFTFACAHAGKKHPGSPFEPISSAKEIHRSMNEPYADVPWWDHPQYAWIFPVVIIIGIGIAVGGTIYIASGAGGLHVAVSK